MVKFEKNRTQADGEGGKFGQSKNIDEVLFYYKQKKGNLDIIIFKFSWIQCFRPTTRSKIFTSFLIFTRLNLKTTKMLFRMKNIKI